MSLFNIDWKTFNVYEFIEGCANSILDEVGLQPEHIKRLVEYRLKICKNCELGSNGYKCERDETMVKTTINPNTLQKVIGCNCPFKCKLPSPNNHCPAQKW